MRPCAYFASLLALALVVLPCSALAAGAYIDQLEFKESPVETATSGGAFVLQLPADARPITLAPTAPAKKQFRKVQFLAQPVSADDDLDQALTPYLAGKRPKLPSVGAGVSVALVDQARARSLPNVGTGVMN